MKITAMETYWTQTPFNMGGKPKAMGGLTWQTMNTVWLRVITDAGIDGWGEAFGHGTAAGSMAVMDSQLAPAILGQDARDRRTNTVSRPRWMKPPVWQCARI
jgi:D-galactarolactone cycloisomerase